MLVPVGQSGKVPKCWHVVQCLFLGWVAELEPLLHEVDAQQSLHGKGLLPVLAAVFRRRKRPVGSSWRMDETYILVGGKWKYPYRAVDRLGQTVDFLLTARRDEAAARRFFERAIGLHDLPEKITIDKSGANTAAVRGLVKVSGLHIDLRQSKYLNNIVEQDHRAIKRRVRPMMGFKSFWSARRIIAGIETMHMIGKGQMLSPSGQAASAAQQFYSLAF